MNYYSLIQNQAQQSGTGEAWVHDATIFSSGDLQDEVEPTFQQGAEISISFKVDVARPDTKASVLVYIADVAMSPIYCIQMDDAGNRPLQITDGSYEFSLDFGRVELSSGKYSLTVVVKDDATHEILSRMQGIAPFKVFSDTLHWGKVTRTVQASVKRTGHTARDVSQ